MLNKLEIPIINFIQSKFYTSHFNYFDYAAKLISSRKYRIFYLILYFLILIWYNSFNNLIIIPSLYTLSIVSRMINIGIKLIFKRRRPYVFSNTILVDSKTREKKKKTFSLPSNSIQTSLTFYNVLMLSIDNFDNRIRILFLTLIFFTIGTAKINRGLHYPSDLIVSLVTFKVLSLLYEIISEIMHTIVSIYIYKLYILINMLLTD